MNHESFEELLSAYALGVLGGDDRNLLQNHLRSGCQVCAGLLPQFKKSAAALAFPPVEKRLRPYVKDRIMQEIGSPSASLWPTFLRNALAPAAVFAAILLYPWTPKPLFYAEVLRSEGQFTIDGMSARPGARVMEGHRFSTSGDSFAYLRIPNVAILKIKAGTQATLRGDAQKTLIELASGSVFSHVRTGAHYAVTTPLATTEARGTYFYVKMDSTERTYVCICNGRLWVSSAAGSGEMQADHHKAVDITLKAGHTEVAADTLRDHSDQEAQTLGASF